MNYNGIITHSSQQTIPIVCVNAQVVNITPWQDPDIGDILYVTEVLYETTIQHFCVWLLNRGWKNFPTVQPVNWRIYYVANQATY